MKKRHSTLMVPLTLAVAVLPLEAAQAQAGGDRMYGRGAPFTADQLPPGLLRSSLDSLPAQARSRAMRWLHEFEFPGQDAAFLKADAEGGILYIDDYQPEPGDTATVTSSEPASAVDPNTTFMLHSKPGASKVLYLDFDGHLIQNTAWNSSTNPSYQARPFDPNNTSGFDNDELARIAEIWHRVAEDLAPFDIDVTTEDPITFGPQTGRLLITHNTDAYGKAMPYSTAGGVAYVNVWGRSDYASYYSPALVYYNNLGNGYAPYVAEAASHEFGHNLGLSHDGTSTQGYYAGHGTDSSYVSWAPVMGVGYYKNVTQWSRGEYAGANNTQDDLAIIEYDLGLRVDDHGDTPASATALVADSTGVITATTPQNDAFNDAGANKGIIESRSDSDLFYVDVGEGPLSLSATPAWDAFYRDLRRGANLDLELALLDESGTVLAVSDPLNNTDGTVSATVPAGRYYLQVRGVGNAQTPYNDYGSLGQYFIEGSITPPAATSTNEAPTAGFTQACTDLNCSFSDGSFDSDGTVTAWAWDFGDGSTSTSQNPAHSYAAAGTYTVTLTVTDDQGATGTAQASVSVTAAANEAPAASFSHSCTDLNCSFSDGSFDSDGTVTAWAWDFGDGATSTSQNPAHSYTAAGTYTVTLTVTDDQGATGTTQASVSVTAADLQPPATPDGLSATDNGDGTASLGWSAATGADSYELLREKQHKNGRWVDTTSLTGLTGTGFTDASGTGSFRYSIRAVNAQGASDWSAWVSVTVSDSSGGGGNGGPGGGGDKCHPKKGC